MSRRDGGQNRLVHEPSLYLQQHANNAVDWFPWGDEAFAEAERRGVPVLVSIGYSSCHWCHVMERESFEDSDVAAYQNAHFVSIKVDREERPDIDRLYMTACQVITKQGGWPLNAFALPDGRPFYAGTYFAPRARAGRPSWRELLEMLHEAWSERREELEESAEELMDIIRRHGTPSAAPAIASDGVLPDARSDLGRQLDLRNGGFGVAPKFPNAATLHLLAHAADGLGDDALREHFALSLSKMADGGIFDHVGGGFARYSTDAIWLVPHFEKMLYDNGQLLALYALGFSKTRNPRFAETIRDIAAWLEREMRSPCGAFSATLDADSEGEEGTFYVWGVDEFEALFPRAAQPWRDFFGVSKRGNFEDTGKSVLSRAKSLTELARKLRLDVAGAQHALDDAKRTLLQHRETRERPARDDKRITAWNALTLQGLARAAMALGDEQLEDSAVRLATSMLERLWDGETLLRLLETRPDGTPHCIEGFLDDYAYLANALVDLALLTQDPSWLVPAEALCDRIVDRFYSPQRAQLRLATAPREAIAADMPAAHDDAIPAPAGIAIRAMQRLAVLTGSTTFDEVIDRVIAACAGDLARYPTAVASIAIAADNHDRGLRMAIAATGDASVLASDERRSLISDLIAHLGVDDVFWFGSANGSVSTSWFEQRESDRGILWYICRGTRCGLPSADVAEAIALLDTAQ